MTVQLVRALEILDSRGNPTVMAEVTLSSGETDCAMVPSGASTGSKEALELRDQDPKRYMGKGVLKAVAHVNSQLADAIIGQPIDDLEALDEKMLSADGTDDKSNLGANAILAVSMALAKVKAQKMQQPLYVALNSGQTMCLPVPMMNVFKRWGTCRQ